MIAMTDQRKPTTYLRDLTRDGFIRIPALLNSEEISSLRDAASNITNMARHGQWPYIRTVPKQFPPWPSTPPDPQSGGIWGVQHLLHPDIPARSVFASLYFSEKLLAVVEELVDLSLSNDNSEKLVMELFNLLVSPSGCMDFELCWHRDDIKSNISIDEESKQLAEKSPCGRQLHVQYNIALSDDESLIVVPGSHRRPRTDIERQADPYAADLPEQVIVQMRAGDAVFYDSNILHRGMYRGINTDTEVGRLTLHGSVGLAGHGKERARQILQHGVGKWIDQLNAEFVELDGLNFARAEAMRANLIKLGKGDSVGFSLEG